MSAFASNFPIHDSAISAYASNVGATARAFFAALLAVKPASQSATPARTRAHFFAALQFEARRYDEVMPNLAAELRSIANRN